MNSPVSNEPMLILELDEVEVDYCPVSGGVWLDACELELLLEDLDARKSILTYGKPPKDKAEKPLRCPVCRKAMEKWSIGDTDPVVSDRCPRGHGLWLDKGELGRILSQAGHTDHVGRVAAFLNSMFPPANPESPGSGNS